MRIGRRKPKTTWLECVGGPFDGERVPQQEEHYRVVAAYDEAQELGQYQLAALPDGELIVWWVRS